MAARQRQRNSSTAYPRPGPRAKGSLSVVALAAIALVAAACGSTSSGSVAPSSTATATSTTSTSVAAASATTNPGVVATALPAPTDSPTSTTSTTVGVRPPGAFGPYPWQAGPRLQENGAPLPSWLSQAATVDARAKSDTTAQLVFLGDSITEGWQSVGSEAWDAVWLPRHPIDFGIEGDTTQNVLWRIGQGTLAGLNPRAVVLLIGTNDYSAGWSAAQVARGIVACATAVRAQLPNAAIVLLSVFPRDTPTTPAAIAVQATNADLAVAQLPANTTLINLTPMLSTSTGAPVPALFSSDLLHPSAEGYSLIAGRLLAVPVLSQQ